MTQDRRPPVTRWALTALLLAQFLLGLAYSALNPLGEAPDEADHYAYIVYIGQEGRLPQGPTVTQGKHPPLYHLVAAWATRWTGLDFRFLRSNPDVGVTPEAQASNFFVHTALESWPWQGGALAMHLARLISLLAGLLLTAATYGLGRALGTAWPPHGGEWPAGALAAAAFVAFLPEALFIGSAVNNDIPAAALATLALWATLRGRRIGDAALAGLFMGLGLLTKMSTGALWPAIGLAMLAQEKREWRRGLGRAALAIGLALLIAAPWLWRNWRLYGDPLGTSLVLATVDRRLAPLGWGDLLWLFRGWFFSFWGKFGGAGHLALPAPLYVLWAGLIGLAGAGWLRRLLRRGREQEVRDKKATSEQGDEAAERCALVASLSRCLIASLHPASCILLGSPLLVALAVISYSQMALGTDQGRLLFPALAPLALLLVGGLAGLSGRRLALLAGGLTATMVLVAVVSLVVGIAGPFAPPPAPGAEELAQAQPMGQLFGEGLELAAMRWGEGSSGQPTAELTLYWRARQPIGADLRTALRIVDSSGNLIWEWKRSPGAGRFSTDRWPPGRVVADVYRVPHSVLGETAHIEVGVYEFPDGRWLSVAGRPDAGPFLLLGPAEGF